MENVVLHFVQGLRARIVAMQGPQESHRVEEEDEDESEREEVEEVEQVEADVSPSSPPHNEGIRAWFRPVSLAADDERPTRSSHQIWHCKLSALKDTAVSAILANSYTFISLLRRAPSVAIVEDVWQALPESLQIGPRSPLRLLDAHKLYRSTRRPDIWAWLVQHRVPLPAATVFDFVPNLGCLLVVCHQIRKAPKKFGKKKLEPVMTRFLKRLEDDIQTYGPSADESLVGHPISIPFVCGLFRRAGLLWTSTHTTSKISPLHYLAQCVPHYLQPILNALTPAERDVFLTQTDASGATPFLLALTHDAYAVHCLPTVVIQWAMDRTFSHDQLRQGLLQTYQGIPIWWMFLCGARRFVPNDAFSVYDEERVDDPNDEPDTLRDDNHCLTDWYRGRDANIAKRRWKKRALFEQLTYPFGRPHEPLLRWALTLLGSAACATALPNGLTPLHIAYVLYVYENGKNLEGWRASSTFRLLCEHGVQERFVSPASGLPSVTTLYRRGEADLAHVKTLVAKVATAFRWLNIEARLPETQLHFTL